MWYQSSLIVALSLKCEVGAAEATGKRGKVRLMEVFSPPRFAPVVESQGHEAIGLMILKQETICQQRPIENVLSRIWWKTGQAY